MAGGSPALQLRRVQPDHAPGVEELRQALWRCIRATSAREVAAQVDLSERALRSFLRGGGVRGRTLRKLYRWYLRFGARTVDVQPDVAELAVTLLLDAIPPGPVHDMTRDALLHVLERGHRLALVAPPGWLKAWAGWEE